MATLGFRISASRLQGAMLPLNFDYAAAYRCSMTRARRPAAIPMAVRPMMSTALGSQCLTHGPPHT